VYVGTSLGQTAQDGAIRSTVSITTGLPPPPPRRALDRWVEHGGFDRTMKGRHKGFGQGVQDSERGLTVGLSSCVGVDVREQHMAVVDLQGRQTGRRHHGAVGQQRELFV